MISPDFISEDLPDKLNKYSFHRSYFYNGSIPCFIAMIFFEYLM